MDEIDVPVMYCSLLALMSLSGKYFMNQSSDTFYMVICDLAEATIKSLHYFMITDLIDDIHKAFPETLVRYVYQEGILLPITKHLQVGSNQFFLGCIGKHPVWVSKLFQKNITPSITMWAHWNLDLLR